MVLFSFLILNCFPAFSQTKKPDIDELRRSVHKNPKEPSFHANLGRGYAAENSWPESLASFQEALKLNPTYVPAFTGMGIAFFHLGRYPEAMDALKQSIKLAPERSDSHTCLGDTYSALLRWQEAIEEYKFSVSVKPTSEEGHFGLGMAYLATNERNLAAKELEELTRLNSDLAKKLSAALTPPAPAPKKATATPTKKLVPVKKTKPK